MWRLRSSETGQGDQLSPTEEGQACQRPPAGSGPRSRKRKGARELGPGGGNDQDEATETGRTTRGLCSLGKEDCPHPTGTRKPQGHREGQAPRARMCVTGGKPFTNRRPESGESTHAIFQQHLPTGSLCHVLVILATFLTLWLQSVTGGLRHHYCNCLGARQPHPWKAAHLLRDAVRSDRPAGRPLPRGLPTP